MPQFNPKAIGTCVPGASVAFVKGPCANGWAQPHYESWGSETDSEDPEPVPPQTPGRILEMPGQVFKILDTSSDTRMVSIEYQGAPLWVNAELLSCGSQPNMSGYVAPHPHAGKDCSYQKLPLDPVSLARLNNDAQAELGLQIVAKAVGYKEEVRKNVAHDNKAMNDAFFDEKRTVDDKDEILTRALKRLKALDKRAAAIYGKNCKPDGIKAATYEIPRERGERMCRTFRNAKKQLEKIMKLPTKQARVTAFENRSFDSELAEDPENMQVSTRSIIYYGLDLERSDTTLGKEAPDLLRLKRSLKLVNRGSCDLTSIRRPATSFRRTATSSSSNATIPPAGRSRRSRRPAASAAASARAPARFSSRRAPVPSPTSRRTGRSVHSAPTCA
ncbi:MAG: hypothetical protein HY075_14765 [Deltaproteobacteria bacterium]|nr:hypothetical protein [Deltaproteobacteria bacterium]